MEETFLAKARGYAPEVLLTLLVDDIERCLFLKYYAGAPPPDVEKEYADILGLHFWRVEHKDIWRRYYSSTDFYQALKAVEEFTSNFLFGDRTLTSMMTAQSDIVLKLDSYLYVPFVKEYCEIADLLEHLASSLHPNDISVKKRYKLYKLLVSDLSPICYRNSKMLFVRFESPYGYTLHCGVQKNGPEKIKRIPRDCLSYSRNDLLPICGRRVKYIPTDLFRICYPNLRFPKHIEGKTIELTNKKLVMPGVLGCKINSYHITMGLVCLCNHACDFHANVFCGKWENAIARDKIYYGDMLLCDYYDNTTLSGPLYGEIERQGTDLLYSVYQMKFKVHCVPGDGNCFFHAIMEGLRRLQRNNLIPKFVRGVDMTVLLLSDTPANLFRIEILPRIQSEIQMDNDLGKLYRVILRNVIAEKSSYDPEYDLPHPDTCLDYLDRYIPKNLYDQKEWGDEIIASLISVFFKIPIVMFYSGINLPNYSSYFFEKRLLSSKLISETEFDNIREEYVGLDYKSPAAIFLLQTCYSFSFGIDGEWKIGEEYQKLEDQGKITSDHFVNLELVQELKSMPDTLYTLKCYGEINIIQSSKSLLCEYCR